MMNNMVGETPIDFAAMRARLSAAIDNSMSSANAHVEAPVVAPVSPASEKKSGRRSHGARREVNQGSDVEKVRMLWIQKTGAAVAGAKNLEQLMSLMELVKTGRGSMKLSFRLPEGLPTLLKDDKTFGEEFNALFENWSNRIIEMLFNEDGVSRFQDSLRDVIAKNSRISSERFFDIYLDSSNLSVLRSVPAITTKLGALWDQYLPVVKPGLKEKKSRPEEIIVGEEYVLRKDPSKEYTVTEITADGEIGYVSVSGGGILHSLKEQFLKHLRAKGNQSSVQAKDLKGASDKKAPTKFAGQHKGGEPDEDAMRRYLDRQAALGKNEPMAAAASPELVTSASAIAITPENLGESLVRTYDELFDLADEAGDAPILMGALTKGIRAMSMAAKEGGVDFLTYHKEHPQDISDALFREMQEFFNHVGKTLGWTEVEAETFSRGLIQKSIEKFINKKV